jgi:hypothetical protein
LHGYSFTNPIFQATNGADKRSFHQEGWAASFI